MPETPAASAPSRYGKRGGGETNKIPMLDLAAEPTEVEVAITIPSIKTKQLAPNKRPFSSLFITPYPDPVLDVDHVGAKLTAKISITFPNGVTREIQTVIEGKSSAPYTRVLKIKASP
jgi:hypothetical protein